jgi:hypothetical protein
MTKPKPYYKRVPTFRGHFAQYTYFKPDGSNAPKCKTSKDEDPRFVYPQAANIIDKFGGARELCRMYNAALKPGEKGLNPSSVYRWTYAPKDLGTGGEIPTRRIKGVLRAARLFGILITIEDLYPKLFD